MPKTVTVVREVKPHAKHVGFFGLHSAKCSSRFRNSVVKEMIFAGI